MIKAKLVSGFYSAPHEKGEPYMIITLTRKDALRLSALADALDWSEQPDKLAAWLEDVVGEIENADYIPYAPVGFVR